MKLTIKPSAWLHTVPEVSPVPFVSLVDPQHLTNPNTVSSPLFAESDVAILRNALADMLSGWRYIRQSYGDLYGVGWERAQRNAESALGLNPGEQIPSSMFPKADSGTCL